MNIEIINKIITEVKEVNWFSNLGKEQNFQMNFETSFIADFKRFTSSIHSLDWENTTLEASNDLSEYLQLKNIKEADDWNKIIEQIKKNLDFVSGLSDDFLKEYGLDIKSDLEWNILFIIVEKYYQFKNPKIPIFFDSLYTIYKNGNIPCGFEFISDWDFSKGGKIFYW